MPLCSVEPSSSHTLISFNNHESFAKTLEKSTHKGPNIFPMLFCHLQYTNICTVCRVTRRVGSDGLLVAWTSPQDDELTGFQVCKKRGSLIGSMFSCI